VWLRSGGNIEVVDASDPGDIQLMFRSDVATPKEGNREFYQWFYFRANNVGGVPCVFNLLNAGGSLNSSSGWTPALDKDYPNTAEWNAGDIGYTARASYDRKTWFAVPTTSFDKESGVLSIALTPVSRCLPPACMRSRGQTGLPAGSALFTSLRLPSAYLGAGSARSHAGGFHCLPRVSRALLTRAAPRSHRTVRNEKTAPSFQGFLAEACLGKSSVSSEISTLKTAGACFADAPHLQTPSQLSTLSWARRSMVATWTCSRSAQVCPMRNTLYQHQSHPPYGFKTKRLILPRQARVSDRCETDSAAWTDDDH
jgi:hypothetical protein